MTTSSQNSADRARGCAEFEERLPAWLEGELADAECSVMDQHRASCVACASLVTDVDEILRGAGSLPALTPSRDLWQGIEARLGAPVISLESRREERSVRVPSRAAGVSTRRFAVAATMLVAVSSGVTWTVARAHFDVPVSAGNATAAVATSQGGRVSASGTTTATAPRVTDSTNGGANGRSISTVNAPPSPTSLASATRVGAVPASANANSVVGRRTVGEVGAAGTTWRPASSMGDVDAIYEREIAALRSIVNQRLTELDPKTVAALRENLRTIDRAILDSRRALQSDPRSGFLSTELDRTLEAKLSLMRRVALL
ncbi:MAG: anti-sigma factor [Gemmatimonas sp.]